MKYGNLNLNCSKKRGIFYLKFLNANVKSETVCPIAANGTQIKAVTNYGKNRPNFRDTL
jgi:hypothetical protein